MEHQNRRPLPKEIYIRRRIAALVILLLVAALLVWGLVKLAGGGSHDADVANTGDGESTASKPIASGGPPSSPSAPPSSESSPAPSSSQSSASPSPSPAPQAAGKSKCELQDLVITASTSAPNYSPDQGPVFYVTVQNPTEGDCQIDLAKSPLRYEVYDMATNHRVWSDIDCNKPDETGMTTFKAGQERHFEAQWSRTTSAPGQCTNRQPVPAGAYFLHGLVGENHSDPSTFNLK